ncbi:unnamed protein product [Symbiodinium microadriaticum]|nr:unnamed protein product [Symbiodinium microadriaticum]
MSFDRPARSQVVQTGRTERIESESVPKWICDSCGSSNLTSRSHCTSCGTLRKEEREMRMVARANMGLGKGGGYFERGDSASRGKTENADGKKGGLALKVPAMRTSMADGGQTKRSQSPLRCRMETRNAPAAEKMQRNREADDEKRSAREVDVPEVGAREADRREADAPEAVTHRADAHAAGARAAGSHAAGARAAGSHAAGARAAGGRAAGAREVESVERSRTDAPEAGGEAALALQRGSRGTGPEVDVGKRNGQEAGRDMPQSPRTRGKSCG